MSERITTVHQKGQDGNFTSYPIGVKSDCVLVINENEEAVDLQTWINDVCEQLSNISFQWESIDGVSPTSSWSSII